MLDKPTEEQIESEAAYWAGRVVNNIKERDEEVSEKEALETLAILDADNNITERMDGDDLDTFLDEFEEALSAKDENAEAIQKRIDDASAKAAKDEEGASDE